MSIVAQGLTVTADTGATLLRNVGFAAEAGAITLIVGRTGSGKSTLLRTLAGLVPPASGNANVGGRPLWVGKRPDRALLLDISLAFQFPEHQLFASTVQGEFDYSLRPFKLPKDERARRTIEALDAQGLPASMLAHPPLLLSGGQKRRVALATILAPRTPWLLLDEPSAGLDAASLSRLADELSRWKRSCGIVLATHDLDAFLPAADRVVILKDGQVIAEASPEELADDPRPLLDAGVGLPESMLAAAALRRAGVPVPAGLCPPERLAEAIAAWPGPSGGAGEPQPAASTEAAEQAPHREPPAEAEAGGAATDGARGFLYRSDATRKWLAYTLVSVGIILQTDWLGTAVAALFAGAGLAALTPHDRRRSLRLSRPLVWLMAFAVTFSGLRFGAQLGFSVEPALETARRLIGFFEITVIGLVFTLSTGTAEMKAGLERGLRPLRRVGVPVEAIALSASLVLRFIPLILEEADRFAAIAGTRGKRGTKPGKVHLLDIPVFVIPLLTGLFQAVEDLILAMELKGIRLQSGRSDSVGTRRTAPQRPRDRRTLWAGVAMFAALACIRLVGEGVL
ncbi:ATP-binding cassette domain-containing protein [Paenibacillus sp.]|uniref:ATP-binding cassette domain-containing protein n=1 Tax=Paenibacillus sp. TaxID=58172 RepID=UPI002D2B324A|nr:ATP-binding cassette domain-containing protein [Paenibacillus sp.]HZG85909.1 ATP-binding cassette domain-containing protein [Paenibacillus sp.]